MDYLYECRNEDCLEVGKRFRQRSTIDERDKQICDECEQPVERVFEATETIQYATRPFSKGGIR